MTSRVKASNFQNLDGSGRSYIRTLPIRSQDIYPGRPHGIVEVTYAIILPKYSIKDP